MYEFDTIAAISTPMGEGAIAIVRLSGEEAFRIIDEIFQTPSSKKCQMLPLIQFTTVISCIRHPENYRRSDGFCYERTKDLHKRRCSGN